MVAAVAPLCREPVGQGRRALWSCWFGWGGERLGLWGGKQVLVAVWPGIPYHPLYPPTPMNQPTQPVAASKQMPQQPPAHMNGVSMCIMGWVTRVGPGHPVPKLKQPNPLLSRHPHAGLDVHHGIGH